MTESTRRKASIDHSLAQSFVRKGEKIAKQASRWKGCLFLAAALAALSKSDRSFEGESAGQYVEPYFSFSFSSSSSFLFFFFLNLNLNLNVFISR